MANKEGRRNFLRNAGAFLAGTSLAGCGAAATVRPQAAPQAPLEEIIATPEPSNPIETFIDNFPAELPGAASVNITVRDPDAQYCLVHIRQMHYVTGLTPNELAEVEEVQADIELTLRHLIDHQNLSAVYQEARLVGRPSLESTCEAIGRDVEELSQEIQESRLDLQEIPRRFRRAIRAEIRESEEFLEEGRELYQDCTSSMEERNRYSATYRFQDQIEIRASETEDVYDRSAQAYRELMSEELDHASPQETRSVFTRIDKLKAEREELLLEIVSRSGDPIGYTVLGGLHYFAEDVQRWNSNQEGNTGKFSLIEITPMAYERITRAE